MIFSLYFGRNLEIPLLVECEIFGAKQIRNLRSVIPDLCKSLRPSAVPLVDALNVPDMALCSELGKKDGDIYRRYFSAVKELDRRSRGGDGSYTPYFEKWISPLLSSL